MKHYNIQNYIRYKKDLESTLFRLEDKPYDEYTRNELVIKFMPLTENLARKFATSQQASGVMAITDMIQEGHLNLITSSSLVYSLYGLSSNLAKVDSRSLLYLM